MTMLKWRDIKSPDQDVPQEAVHWVELMQRRDHYSELRVSRDASPAEIKHAYRRMALRYHPDLNRELSQTVSEYRMRRLNAAYGVLSSPERRDAYDRSLN
jgi:curved DNA-binding protein